MNMSIGSVLPYFAEGIVVKGFGRGSKSLGIPTANLSSDVIKALPSELKTGIYCGFASIFGKTYKMVMSIGWNPFYKNKEKSMEVHILHTFNADFYSEKLKIIALEYIREEKDFTSVDHLIAEIKNDISIAEQRLEEPIFSSYKNHPFFNAK